MANIAVIIPEREHYGAIELKEHIRKDTIRGIIVSISTLLVFLIIYTILVSRDTSVLMAPVIPMNRLSLENIKNDDDKTDEQNAPEEMQNMVNTGPAARAGNPVPAPDSEITPDMKEFASVEEISRTSAIGGNGDDNGGFASNINFNEKTTVKENIEVIPPVDKFIAVEEMPKVADYSALQKSVVYPDIAQRAGIEGKVIVAVWVDKNGKPKKAKVIDSPNNVLDKASMDAVLGYTAYTPAIQNKQPVGCWLQIPINFKLK
jgi:protein TonB